MVALLPGLPGFPAFTCQGSQMTPSMLHDLLAPTYRTPVAPVAPPPALLIGPANPSPLIIPDSSSNEIDEMAWRTEIALLENAPRQPSSPSVRTFRCPYCQQDGLDDLDLRDHCNANHLSDTRSVVCPVCVSLPHGDPLYHSRDFIGHLNLRHCYYIEDITNIHQSDDVNLQAAILMSLTQANQIAR
ncbi:E3 ubiquitin-protein ligase RNF114 isoform X2 [Colossoma macropomum]|uniref:E3 ubiquitin-protein ligase RNF114 isoform X2 n=1 Tax=Colossoma macropomum TaxID=42526 RepID=UPI0018649A7E|nr:E3 ubiquitin-protein ligase RNF114 isoform X2 [Colossoma macropomum]